MDLLDLVERLHTPLLVVMVAVFGAIVLWAYAPSRRQTMEDSARIPLRDDN